jgi:hypothetical protein
MMRGPRMSNKQSLTDLITIFTIKKKSQLKQRCRSITILYGDLTKLVLASAAGILPLSHRSYHREFQPEHLHLSEDDLGALAVNGDHWDGGSHIHLINHLWPARTAQVVWDEFRTGNSKMRSAMHVRFRRRSATTDRMTPERPFGA